MKADHHQPCEALTGSAARRVVVVEVEVVRRGRGKGWRGKQQVPPVPVASLARRQEGAGSNSLVLCIAFTTSSSPSTFPGRPTNYLSNEQFFFSVSRWH